VSGRSGPGILRREDGISRCPVSLRPHRGREAGDTRRLRAALSPTVKTLVEPCG